MILYSGARVGMANGRAIFSSTNFGALSSEYYACSVLHYGFFSFFFFFSCFFFFRVIDVNRAVTLCPDCCNAII